MSYTGFDRFRGRRGVAVLLALLTGCAFAFGAGDAQRPVAARESPAPASPPAGQEQDLKGMAFLVRFYFKPLPEKMPGSGGDTPQMVALGRRLFFENGISRTKTQSCNDCHRLDRQQAGVDNQPVSKGAVGLFGKRNSPTVLNAGFQLAQFWDGRASNLEEQAKGPVLNPIEMGMRSPAEVVDRMKKIDGCQRDFELAFPNDAEPMTYDNAVRAIAAFERTLVAPARFDRYLKGERNALSPEEEAGLRRFVETGCADCHNSHPVGGRMFQNLGICHPYKNGEDLGRHAVTHQDEDKGVFKVPMLRNVTRTAPYFHDGQVADLREAVRQMAWMQLDVVLKAREIDEIVHFLGALESQWPLAFSASLPEAQGQ